MLEQRKGKDTNKGYIVVMIIIGMLGMYSCSDDNSATGPEEEPDVAEVVIEPQNAIFEVGEQHDFSAFLISADGDTVNDEFEEIEWNWYSSDPDVFTVEDGGTATGHNEGEAHCVVEVSTENTKIVAKMRFVGRDSAFVTLLK